MGRGWKRILQDVPALRTDGQGPHGGPQGEPLQHQDQAPVLPNLCNVTFISDALGRNVRLRVSTNAIKSVDHRGGFDAFLIKAKGPELSQKALLLKKAIEKKIATTAAPEAAAS